MSWRRRGVALTISALLVIVGVLSGTISIVLGQGNELQDPRREEKTLFQTIRNRHDAKLAPGSISDILNSLGADGTGKQVSVATKECRNKDYDKCEIIIKTRLVRFNCNIPPADGDAKFGREKAEVKIENRVKKLYLYFFVMINPGTAKVAE